MCPLSSPEHEQHRARVRAQLAEAVLPNADRWEAQGYIDRDGWRLLGRQGLLDQPHSGHGFLRSAISLDELGRTGYAGIRAAIGVHAFMALSYLLLFGSAEQRRSYVAAAHSGARIGGLALTEAEAGSDLSRIRATATWTGGRYLVSGEKLYVANGCQADFLIVLARTGPAAGNNALSGASLLIVNTESPGLTRDLQPMLGWHSAGLTRITFDEVAVPAGRVLGRANRALPQLLRALDFERLVAGLLAVGGVHHCLDLLGRFVRQRQVKNGPLAAHQLVQQRLAGLESRLELVRHYGCHAAVLHSRGILDTRTASVLKVEATELAMAAAIACAQFHGAQGYLRESAVARLYRDAAAGTIAGGASEVLREAIFETGGWAGGPAADITR
jgi:acyl-CoA dehydrogenase